MFISQDLLSLVARLRGAFIIFIHALWAACGAFSFSTAPGFNLIAPGGLAGALSSASPAAGPARRDEMLVGNAGDTPRLGKSCPLILSHQQS